MTSKDFNTFKIYAKVADELQTTVPIVAYYLKTYTVNKALDYLKAERAQGKDISQYTPELKQWIESLEALKASLSSELMNKDQCKQQFRDYTSNLFQQSEQNYRNANYTRNLAKDFLYASVLFDAWELIEAQTEDIKAKKNFANEARFKIMDNIIKGTTPIPTPDHTYKEETPTQNQTLPPSNSKPEKPPVNDNKKNDTKANSAADPLAKLNFDVTDSVFVPKSVVDKLLEGGHPNPQPNLQPNPNSNPYVSGFEQPNYGQFPQTPNNFNFVNEPNYSWNYPPNENPYYYSAGNYGAPGYNYPQSYPTFSSVQQYPTGPQNDANYQYIPPNNFYPQYGMPNVQQAQQYPNPYETLYQPSPYYQPENVAQQFPQIQNTNPFSSNPPYYNYPPYGFENNAQGNVQQPYAIPQPYNPYNPYPNESPQPSNIPQPLNDSKQKSTPKFPKPSLTTPGGDNIEVEKENISPNIPEDKPIVQPGMKSLKKSKTWNLDKPEAETTCVDAKEHCKMAISELDFLNVKQAKENIIKALKFLEKIEANQGV